MPRSWIHAAFLLSASVACMGATRACTNPDHVTITGYTIVAQRAVSAGVADYDITLSLRNNMLDTPGFVGTVRSTGSSTTVVENEIVVGDLKSGETRGTPDTFTVRAPTSAPASFAVDWHYQSSTTLPRYASGPVGITGGTVAHAWGDLGATFEGGFGAPTTARVYLTNQPTDRLVHAETTDIFRAGAADPLELRVEVMAAPPGDDVVVWFAPSVASGRVLWVRIPQDTVNAAFDEYVTVPTVELSGGRLQGSIPPSAFKAGGFGGSFEALVMAAPPFAGSGSRASLSGAASAAPVSHVCPVVGGCVVTSPFNLERKHPVTGVVRPHLGIDYAAPDGTLVRASAAGVVERSYFSSSFGHTIVLRHDDGSATRYAHLERRDVSEGALVSSLQTLGASGHTGLSKGPHLHFELVQDGPDGAPVHVNPAPLVLLLKTVRLAGAIPYFASVGWSGAATAVEWDGVYLGHVVEYDWTEFAVEVTPGSHVVTCYPEVYGWFGANTFDLYLNGATFLSGATVEQVIVGEPSFFGWPAIANLTVTVP